ncbi:MAG: hypothetical protein WBM40_20130 [Thiohalocapsa sp.]
MGDQNSLHHSLHGQPARLSSPRSLSWLMSARFGAGPVAKRLAWLVVIALLGVATLQPAVAQQPCLKMVFNRYCLGGDVNRMAQQLAPALQQDEGDRVALIYYEGRERIYALAWRGRVYKVLRVYRIASQLRYEELYRVLREKYGDGEDRSSFPSSARTPGRKQIAIRRGEGEANHVWQTSEGWHIELAWTRELGLSLAYIADELEQAQAAALQSGY